MKRHRHIQDSSRRRLSRREILRLGGTAALGAAVGPFVWTSAKGQTFDWTRFRGKELFIMLAKHPWPEEMVK
ncbi:MAG TPA: hypothetical protein VGC81_18260, partial [Candidatus Methylomirabilis sp.]